MNKKLLERVLSKEGSDELEMLLNRRTNTKISRYLVEVIEYYLKDFNRPTTQKDLDSPSWAMKRAYRDGGEYYLKQMLDIFKEK